MSATPEPAPESQKCILIVDDTPINIGMISGALKDSYKTKIATNGEKALSIATGEDKPDLILLDVMMPVMDGYEVCRRLKVNSYTRDIPVIFLTGQTGTEDETKGFEVGAVDYIHKPFSEAVVKARVHTHLTLREAHAQIARQLVEINRELEMARQIQLSILPRSTPKIQGLEIVARYLPMGSVAGDFYDFVVVDDKHVGILIADVSGHGLPSALIASMVESALTWQRPHASEPSRVLSGLNRAIYGKFEGHFVTAAYLFADMEKGTVTYAGAGHPPLLMWQPKLGRVIDLVENGLVLGLIENPDYSSVCFSPQQGDRIVMFTDGIVEATNSFGSEFGLARLRQILESKHDLPSGRFVDAVLYGLSSWSEHAIGSGQSDDTTLLGIDFKAPF